MPHCVCLKQGKKPIESPTAFHRFHLLGKDITGPMGNNLPKLGFTAFFFFELRLYFFPSAFIQASQEFGTTLQHLPSKM